MGAVNGMNGQTLEVLLPEAARSWRDVFTFRIDKFIDLWTPLLFGLISLMLHMGHTRWDAVADNWITFSFWFLLMALWGSFGYAGNLGILTGFLNSSVTFFGLLCLFICPAEERVMDLSSQLGMLHLPNFEG